MREFFSRPHPWLMQAVGGLIALVAIAPIAAYVFINVINAKTAAEPAAFALPPSGQTGGAQPAPAPAVGGQAPGGAIAHPTWANVHAIFAANCTPCHVGSSSPMAGLNLGTYQSALKGGSTAAGGVVNGAVIKPGNAAASYLYQAVAGTQKLGQRMPFGRTPLPQQDIKTIYNWIQNGAKS